MNFAKVRKAVVAVVGMALTVGLGLGLTGTAGAILTAVAGLATALGVYRVPNAPATPPKTNTSGTQAGMNITTTGS